MRIVNIEIDNIRSIDRAVMKPTQGTNLVLGCNGSGKTSLMEAIALLGYSRSFIPCQTRELISFGRQYLQIFAEVQQSSGITERLGFRYHQKGEKELRLNGEKSRTDELVRCLPLVILSPRSFDVLEGAASERRKRIDWGVFHVKQGFRDEWHRYRKLLAQRNAALKQARKPEDLRYWTDALVESASKVTKDRREYVQQIIPMVHSHLKSFGLQREVFIEDFPGWTSHSSLASQIEHSFESDKRQGITQKGAHRYDLRLTVEGHKAKNILSRGEKKRVLCALLFAQIEQLRAAGKESIAIVDDLASEFDQEATDSLVARIVDLCPQTFITSIGDSMHSVPVRANKKFHMKLGCLSEA